MVDLFYFIYRKLDDSSQFLRKIRFYSVFRKIIHAVANIILPISFLFNKRKHYLNVENEGNDPIIVSLTTFPARITKVWLVIETILRQKKKPQKIILWLSKNQFNSIDLIPQSLLSQISRGLEIKLVDEDLRSHKKYFYALSEFPKYNIVTIDDDFFYESRFIEDIYQKHLEFPESVIARYAYKISYNNNELKPYKFWERIFEIKEPSLEIFFGSGGGTLFPPQSLPKETLNKKIFIDLCFNADDIWLNAMCRYNNTKIFRPSKYQIALLPVKIKNNSKLSSLNYTENQNDIQINNVRKYYFKNFGIDLFEKP